MSHPLISNAQGLDSVRWKLLGSRHITMIVFFVISLIGPGLLWLFAILPYRRRNGSGFTPGANIAVSIWVDWQEGSEIARENNDRPMILICRIFLLFNLLTCGGLGTIILFQVISGSK